MEANLRLERVLIGRKRSSFHQNLVASCRRSIERRHHEVQVYRQRIHYDDFRRICPHELRSQYSLAFKPDDIHDGKSHKIVVKVDIDGDGQYDDKAYVVKAREVYNAPKPDAASSKAAGGKQ